MSLFSSLGRLYGVITTSSATNLPKSEEDNSRHIMLNCAEFLEKTPHKMICIESELPYLKEVIVKAFINEIKNAQMVFDGAAIRHKAKCKEDLEIIKNVFVHLLQYQPIDENDLELVQLINTKMKPRPDLLELAKANPESRKGLKVGLEFFIKYSILAQEEANRIFKNNKQDKDLDFLTSAYNQIITMTKSDIRQLENIQ